MTAEPKGALMSVALTEDAADLEARTRAAAHACRRHPSVTVRQSTADAHAEAVARLVALRAPAAPTVDDLACAVAVLAETADRAQRLASLYRTPEHRVWAERAARAHAAIVQLQNNKESKCEATTEEGTTMYEADGWEFLQDDEIGADHLDALTGAVNAMANMGAGSAVISALTDDDELLAMYAAVKVDGRVIGCHLDATQSRTLWAVYRP